jgi:site-specific DNA-methyltransferase (adenine-specific)
MAENILYYGDNLYWLRRLKDETVDLIYLDPPFNSNRSYNVLFKDERGTESEAQIMAFEDTWHWNQATEEAYDQLVQNAPSNVVHLVAALREAIGTNQMMAYLVMMTVRLVELHRVLKPTGSLYLHCDPTASHYLKIMLDTIFGAEHFLNEITWKRTTAHSSAKRYGPVHDILLFYSKTDAFLWNEQFIPYGQDYLASHYRLKDADGKLYTLSDLTGAGTRNGPSGQTWRKFDVTAKGRHWAYLPEALEELDLAGLIYWPPNGGWPRYKRYLDASPGTPLQDVWDDISPVNSMAQERLGYPTQKPLALLERIISASSNPGDVVLDPFCGCGTAVAAAQKSGRRWIGIDITHLSIALLKYRLEAMFPGISYKVDGEPKDMGAARKLKDDDRYQFQYWACSLVRAKPLGGQVGSRSGKKGSDRGVDGIIDFEDDASGKLKKIIVQVKSGHVKSGDIRDLEGTIQREKAEMGVFITLEKPTGEMNTEAVTAGFYTSPWGKHPRIQILTIEELLMQGKRVDMPPQEMVSRTFKRAERAQAQSAAEQLSLLDAMPAGESVATATLTDEDDEPDDDFEQEDA